MATKMRGSRRSSRKSRGNIARRSPLRGMRVIDFRNIKTGTLVKRSTHWFKEHGGRKVGSYESRQIGVITGHKFFEDKVAGVVCYPIVHWEGAVMDSMTHPANVALYRQPAVPLQWIEIDPNE